METKGLAGGFVYELGLILRRSGQVWRLIPQRHKFALGAAALVMAVTGGTNTALALLLGRLINVLDDLRKQNTDDAVLYRTAALYLGLLAAAYLLRESFNVMRRYLVENTCTRLDRDLTVRVVSHLMMVELARLTHEKVGALNGRISRSVNGFVRFLRITFLDFFPAVLTGSIALTAAILKQPWMGVVMAAVVPVSLFLTVWQLISQKGIRVKLMRSREAMDGTVVEQLGGLDYVRVANTQRQEIERVAAVAEKRRAEEIRHHFEMSLFGSGKALNEGLFHILVLAFAVYFAIRGWIQFPGDILTFSILFLNVMTPLTEVHRVLDEGHENSLLVGDLLDLLNEPVDRSFHPVTVQTPRLEVGKPVFVIEDLHVHYRTADDRPTHALRGVSMCIRHGETIGVAGRSGSGKSTWLRVLMRLTHPSAGKVLIGGVPLEAVSREAIGELIGYVGQLPFVFEGTIAENIAYGSKDVTQRQIERAARLAHLHHEILAMPGGYEARVAERGQNLSGGQKQRLAIARVFLKNPPILILDEGTSALDNISERNIQAALLAARSDRTTILVAHRLSTLRDADRILVFDESRVVEEGAYSELVPNGGVFTELVHSAEQSPLTYTSPALEGLVVQETTPEAVSA